ncbi:MAG TPA: glutamyl-tRNA reductase [Gemmatimonadaceae bacterium]|nr:glutamyl-tRNA reductase [Gemmatimonadaceae bacterium]
MALIVVGVSHRTAALDVRERLTFRPSEMGAALERMRRASGAEEGVMLSTCNRTEIYLVEGEQDAAPAVWAELSERLRTDASAYGYVRRDREAVGHLFRVAAGLDSMVLGEAQIHGQVRDAWEACRGQSGVALNRLFQSALSASGRVREDTAIARGAASVSSAAVQLAKQIFGTLRGRRAMVLGAGEMAALALECLVDEGVNAAVVANRTHAHAVELADRYGARAMHFDECWRELPDVDLVLSSTASPHPVVTVDRVREAVGRRGDRPLCILDIAVPRDVEPEVGALGNVFLYDLDSLQQVIQSNLDRRRGELPAAEQIVNAEMDRYWEWLAGLSAVPVLRSFRARMDGVREAELAAALRRLRDLTPEERGAVEYLTKSLMNKFMHEPSVRLRAASANGRGLGVVDAMRYLFALDAEPAAPAPAGDEAEPSTKESLR